MKRWLIRFVVVWLLLGAIVFLLHWNLKRITTATYNRFVAGTPYDVIIVPGAPYDTGRQNIILRARMFWAQSLIQKDIAHNVIFSGAAVHTPWCEGKVMKLIADSLGITADHTFVENRAEHGNQNIYYSYKLAQKLGFKKVALATDAYQNFFLDRYIDNKMPGLARLPLSLDSFAVYDKRALPVVNPIEAFVKNFTPLKDRVSRYERFTASWGLEIKEAH